MYTILLSGGSGKRLWPFSGSLRSKQYIRFLTDEQTGSPCSMVQRMWGQLNKAGMAKDCVICASEQQTEILVNQLGNVNIVVEPTRCDTFSAIALSCAYLKDRMHASDDDVVCILPVDPYTDQSYFETIKRMPQVLTDSGAQIALMGVKPVAPSSNYGYILPKYKGEGFVCIDRFVEKPNMANAKKLIRQGALWNVGVFCLRIKTVIKTLQEQGLASDYDYLCREYSKLPCISFDYMVVEKCESLAAVEFEGTWEDIGTWSAASKILGKNIQGNCVVDSSCRNVSVINGMDAPVVALGVKDLIVIANNDGVLVTGSHSDLNLKQIVSALPPRPVFEEKSWGTITILDFFCEDGIGYLVRKLWVKAGQGFQQHCEKADGSLSVLKGNVTITMRGVDETLFSGDCFSIPAGEPYSLLAGQDGLLATMSQKGAEEVFS